MKLVNHKLIFLHIEKAGGSTFHNILSNYYDRENILHLDYMSDGSNELLSTDLKKLTLVKGHNLFGIHKQLGNSFKYYSMMRNPEDRVISYYYYIRQKKSHHHSKLIIEKGWELEEYIKNAENLQMDNGQVRYISGSLKPFGEINREDLDLAKYNIENHFLTVGLTEKFDESMIILKLLMNWKKYPVYERANVNLKKENLISPSAKKTINDFNHFDRELYDFVTKRFGSEFSESSIKMELNRFSKAVRIYHLKKKITGIFKGGNDK